MSGEKEARLFPPQNKALIKTQGTAVRRADRTPHPSPLSRDPYHTHISNAASCHSGSEGAFRSGCWKESGLVQKALLLYRVNSAQSFHCLRDSVWDQVQSTRGHSKPRSVKANKAPCVVVLRVALYVEGYIFKKMQVRLKSQQERSCQEQEKRSWDELCLQIQKAGDDHNTVA